MNRKLRYGLPCMVAACSFLSDAAVDLATCIRKGADDMSSRSVTTSQVICSVRSKRTVTVILTPSTRELSESDVSVLRQMGVPEEAIYYNGPDSPSTGQRVGLGPVNVYDPHFADNRKYSSSSAIGSQTKIATLMSKTGDHFRVSLHRRSDGTVEVVGLR
ncbi:MAG: hypothetical protein ACSLFK_17040 [Gemmatimonadaceae bacterium]